LPDVVIPFPTPLEIPILDGRRKIA